MTNKSKPTYSIRGKLISAVAMLLVALIMVVSSTYAWFTLSTAPEVKGINTAIGANGALEIALNNGGDIESKVVGENQPATITNIVWGNLVDLSDTSYGSAKIVLLPSKLALTQNGTVNKDGSILQTPVYGSDGRVTKLDEKTVTGTFNDGSFYQSNDLGFRAVGIASGMTDRQLTYRNAMAAAGNNMSAAKVAATNSLEANGAALANIAIKHGTSDGENYTAKEVGELKAIVTALLAENGPIDLIEDAYKQYVLAYAATDASGLTDLEVTAFKALVETSTLAELTAELPTLPDAFKTYIDLLNATKTKLTTAGEELDAVPGDGTATWDDITGPLHLLANTEAMTVNDKTVNEIKADTGAFAADAASKGVMVKMATDGGVYADIADHCGDYTASIFIDIVYGTLNLPNFPAKMATVSTVTPYLKTIGAAIPAAPTGDTNADNPMTEFYGFIVDLAFRTNAAQSDLLLQTTPTDRIYRDNAENDLTWGGGSTMTFASTSNSFTTEQMKTLMGCIRIVFFDTAEGTVYGTAVLDAENATNTADGLTANMYLAEIVTTYTYASTDEAGEPITVNVYSKDGTTYYEDEACTTEAEIPEGIVPTEGTSKTTMITNTADAKITPLTQNTPALISALVYLDGETLTNADVAADVAASMSGKMNLQFSSSANLVPMEYADYHMPNAAETPEEG